MTVVTLHTNPTLSYITSSPVLNLLAVTTLLLVNSSLMQIIPAVLYEISGYKTARKLKEEKELYICILQKKKKKNTKKN